jgi:hypothetical protein
MESMGVEYNQLGEECKSSKQEKDRKYVWVGDPILVHSRVCIKSGFKWSFRGRAIGFRVWGLEGSCVDMLVVVLEL